MKKWHKVLLIVLGSLLLFFVILTLSIGPITKHYLEKHSKELCHRTMTMDKLRVNLFTGGVTIYDLKVLEEDDQTTFMSFNSLKMNVGLFPLFAKKLVLRNICLDNPNISVTQNDTVFNFSDMLEFFRMKQSDTEPSEWLVDLRDISITNGNISYADLQMNSSLCMKNINMEVPHLCFGKGSSDAALQLMFDKGGDLDVKVEYGMDKTDFVVHLNMEDFNLEPIEPYLHKWMNFNTLAGEFSANLSIKGTMRHILDLNASGSLSLKNMDISTDQFDHTITMNSMTVDINQINLEKKIVHIKKVEVDALMVNVDINENGNSLSQLFASSSENQQDSEEENTSQKKKNKKKNEKKEIDVDLEKIEIESSFAGIPADVKLDRFLLNDCQMNLTVSSTKEGVVTFPVKDIKLDAHNLSSKNLSKASLSAHLGKTGEFQCKWEGYLSSTSDQDIELGIENLQLQELSPLCIHYFAYPISKGVLVYKGKTTIKNSIIDSKNHIDLHNLVLGKKCKDVNPEFNVPLQTAVNMITDVSGCAKVDIPVNGDLNDPKFSFNKVLSKALLSLIFHGPASSADLKSSRANADAFKDMIVELNQESFTSRQYNQFNTMCETMKENPELVVVVVPSFNAANYNQKSDEKTNKQTIKSYERIQRQMHAHFAKYGISKDRIVFAKNVGKKFVVKGNILLSFDVRTSSM